jgi:ABC-type Fe3+ transport system substrate-binding protein
MNVLLIIAALLILFPSAGRAQDRLVLISPHWEGIRYEFGNGFKRFYQKETGRPVELEWIDVGGTSEMLRFIKSEFKSKPDGIDVDIVFGGGGDPYLELARVDLLEPYRLPDSLLAAIPPKIGGYPLYDEAFRWYGATMAGFGIIFNRKVMDMMELPEIKTWRDLTDPAMFSWIGAADPRKSGSAHMPYEIILQAYGWEKGWQIITAMGANTRSFASAASQIPKEVTIGEVASGMSIDFYAWAQINEVGPDMIGYIMPDNLTIVNPDAIGILRGASNPDVARAFFHFVFSEAGQRLWIQKTGTPGGPEKFQLNRFSVRPELYRKIDPAHTSVTLNPFTWSSSFVYDAEKGSSRWNVVNDLVGTFIIDSHKQLQNRWKQTIEQGNAETALPALAVMPVTEQEAFDLEKTRWQDQAVRNRTLLAWGELVDQKYGRKAGGLPAGEMALLFTGAGAGLILMGYLWRLNRKKSA